MFKVILSTLFSLTIAKKYIVSLKQNRDCNKWMKDSKIKNNHMKSMNVGGTNIVFIDTDLKPEDFTNNDVLSIEEDKIMKPFLFGENGHGQAPTYTCSKTWGLDRINEEDLPLDNIYLGDSSSELRGDDVDIYILDTGINVDHTVFGTPPTFLANFGAGPDTDCHSHGTHVAGSAAGYLTGVSPNSTLYSIKISSWCVGEAHPGSAYCSDMIQAIDYVKGRMNSNGRKTVINLSYGICPSVTTAINEFTAAGGLFALAAGNDAENQCTNAEYSSLNKGGAMIVGASGSADDVAYFSNYGSCVDIYAPGRSILSGDYSNINSCSLKSGTSMASPHIAGAFALLWARNPGMTNIQVRSLLMGNALSNKLDFGSFTGNNKLLYIDNNVSPSPIPTPTPTPDDSDDSEEDEEKWYEIILKKWWLIFPLIGFFFACIGTCSYNCCRPRTIVVVRELQPGEYIV